MKTYVIGAALCAAGFFATPLFADTQDAENKALVQAGCLAASDINPPKLKRRTAIRCFQKALAEETTGVLTRAQQKALLEGKTTSGTQQATNSTAPGNWNFVDDTARFYDPKSRYTIVLKCHAEQLKLDSIASNVRAGNAVTLSIGRSSFEAVVDDGHVAMRKAVPASFTGRYDQHLGRLISAARSGEELTIKWPAASKTVSTRGLSKSLTALKPVCAAESDVDRLLISASGDQRLYDAAVAAGSSGLPSLTTQTSALAAVSKNRLKAWEAFGFEFRQIDGNVIFVASIRPDSPAFLRGLRVGDVVEGDSISGFKGGGVDGLHRTMASLAEYAADGVKTREWKLSLTRPSKKVALEIVIPSPGEAASNDDIAAINAPALPPTLRNIEHDATMVALWRHQITAVDNNDKGDAVMRTLYAFSHHVNACYGANPAVIPFQVILTEVERNGFGLETNRDVTTFDKALKVRPAFEALARRNLRFFSDNLNNERFVAVRDLISQDGCDGRRVQWLEAGLAKAAGVDAVAPEMDATLGEDWRGFVASCLAETYPNVINAEANAARLCNIVEAVLVEMGQADAYEVYKSDGLSANYAWTPADKATFDTRIDTLYRSEGGEIRERGETFVQEAGLF